MVAIDGTLPYIVCSTNRKSSNLSSPAFAIPSDLTADHVYDHTDGDLYWWITNGIGDVMPPLGAALDDDARWNVIDFVRANADASRLGRAAGKVAKDIPAPRNPPRRQGRLC